MSASPVPQVLQVGTPEPSRTQSTVSSDMTPVNKQSILKNRKLWAGVGIGVLVTIGVAVPVALTRNHGSATTISTAKDSSSSVVPGTETVGTGSGPVGGSESGIGGGSTSEPVCTVEGDTFLVSNIPTTVGCIEVAGGADSFPIVANNAVAFLNSYGDDLFFVRFYETYNSDSKSCESILDVSSIVCQGDEVSTPEYQNV
jgi:hypothetical protein